MGGRMERYGFILAGGDGERFWPLSRRKTPKQLLNLSGKEIMVNEAIDRLSLVCPRDRIRVITSALQAESMKLATAGRLSPEAIFSEPAPRNTAACVGLAAVYLKTHFGDGIMIVTPSDAYIRDNEGFKETLEKAVSAAEEGDFLVTVGIPPAFPATGYGYIRFEEGEKPAKKVIQFIEKPDLKRAKQYLAEGDTVWNSGMFVFRASAILKAYRKFIPETAEILERIGMVWEGRGSETLEELYLRLSCVSIDVAVMEKSENLLMVPGNFGWSDVGSWDMLSALYGKDENGNVIAGDFVGEDVKDCVIFSGKKLVSAVGLRNLVIVETPDAILVCEKDRAQEVKKLVERLRAEGREEFL